MKKNLFSRLSALALTLAMLLPCVLTAPVRAAGDTITPTPLFQWTANTLLSTNRTQVADNLMYSSSSLSTTHKVETLSIPTADGGTQSKKTYFLNTMINSGTELGLHPQKLKGWPRTKNRQSLELTFNNFTSSNSAADLKAANVRLTYVHPHTMNATPVFAIDEFDVQVQVGKEWLDGSVGIRNWTLLGHSTGSQTSKNNFIFDLQTENLFNIEGFDPANLTNIRIRPHGEYYYSYGWFGVSDVTVNGYETEADFKKAVPDGRTFTYVGEEKMRDIVLENAYRIAETEWTTDSTLYYGYSALGSAAAGDQTYPAGYPYRGPAYTRIFKHGYELWTESIVDGKYTGGYTPATGWGMDCTSFAYDCYSRVSRSASWVLWQTQSDPKLKLLGDLQTRANGADATDPDKDVSVVYTDYDIVNKDFNSEQAMYNAYAQLKPGDIVTTYTSDGKHIHIRIVADTPEVKYLYGNYIYGTSSKLAFIEQANTYIYYYLENGTKKSGSTTSQNLVDRVTELKNSGCELLYITSIIDDGYKTYSFNDLYKESYVPLTIAEYETGKVEDLNFQSVLLPKAKDDFSQGFSATVAANYHINKFTIQLLDTTTGEVLYSDTQTGNGNTTAGEPHQLYYDWYYDTPELDAVLAQLPNGSYRIAVSVLAGPVTDLRADRPTTTHYRDFEITGKATSATTVSVSASPTSVTKGDTITVPVKVSGSSYAAADVEIKFDADQLTYVSGSVTPSGLVWDVQADKGIARIVLVGANATAGKLAELTFTAKQSIDNVAKLFTVKSAQLSKTDGSYISVSFNGSDHSCASTNFTDVAPNSWYHDAVDYVLKENIMDGYNAATFGPNDSLSRAMMVQILYNKANQPAVTQSNKFPDVRAGDWAGNAIAWAQLNGVVAGYGDGTFRPNYKVTLEQIAVMLWNNEKQPTGSASISGKYDSWAANALSWAQSEGIFEGMACSDFTVTATRAQAAQMLMNYFG